jgi:dephospho-CoA kinase
VRRIAITGGVGEGKSTVLRYVHELGVTTVTSDAVARQVFNQADVQSELSKATGLPEPILPEQLRDAFTRVPHLRRTLNRVMHPVIRTRLLESGAQVAEVPLLYETCMQSDFDRVWVVTCGPEEQLRRVTARLGNEGAARRLIATQVPTRAKTALADRVVRTNCEEAAVQEYVAKAIRLDLVE